MTPLRLPRSWSAAAAASAVVFVVYISLVPFNFTTLGRDATVVGVLRSAFDNREVNIRNLVANAIMCTPIGFFGLASLVEARTTRWRWVAAAAGVAAASLIVSAGVEMLQAFVPGRTPSLIDVTAQSVGTAIGLAAWVLFARVVGLASDSDRAVAASEAPPHEGAASARRIDPLLTACLIASAVGYAAYNLDPFDFVSARDLAPGRFTLLARVPFDGYYQNPEFKALADVFIKMGLALPLGVLFEWRVRPGRSGRGALVTMVWLIMSALFFSAIEIGQVFLPSRYPDSTDVLLALGGVWLGLRLARVFAIPNPRSEARESGYRPTP